MREEQVAMANDGGATYGYYMVGVFDVLGQSGKLREQASLPLVDDEAERRRIVQNLKGTAGVVIGFRQLFKTFFAGGHATQWPCESSARTSTCGNARRDVQQRHVLGRVGFNLRGSSVGVDTTSGCLSGRVKTGHLWTPQNRPFPASRDER